MSAPASRWKLGLFVLCGVAGFVAGLTWLGMTRLKQNTLVAWVYFDEAVNGLEKGSPVKFRGVSIGSVDDILVALDKKHLAVRALLFEKKLIDVGLDPSALSPGCPLPEKLRAQLVSSWVTGTSFVQVDFFADDPGGPPPLPFPTPPNTIRSVRSTFKSLEDGMRELVRGLPDLTASARDLFTELRRELDAAHLPELSQRFDRVLAAAETKVSGFDDLAVVRSAGAAFEELRGLLQDARRPDGPTQKLLHDLDGTAVRLQQVLDRADLPAATGDARAALQAGTAAAGEFAELAHALRGDLEPLRAALAAIERLANVLEREPGALLHGRAGASTPLKDK